MNKFKKTAVVVTSIVMAGTMVFSFSACGGGEDETGGKTISMEYTADTQINIAIGYNSYDTGAFYSSEGSNVISGTITLPGGYEATSSSIKPAMYAIQEALDVQFVDKYTGLATSANIDSTNSSSLVATNAWGSSVDIATSDLSVAVQEATTNSNILNLADYLDYMPNFKTFLEENPVVYLSLLQDGMDTTTGEGQAIYVAPYFDGNDDIERYCLIRQDWVEELLDDTLAYDGDTYADACATTTSVSGGYMGTTGSYTIETSSETGDGSTFTLTKDYDAAKTAAANTSTDLGAAYSAIAGSAYTGTSGNIVDIMNAAIAANSGATGKQLATLYRAYIDVAYKNGSSSAYGSTRSNLFNGYSAAWDVDDLVAMLRIVKTNSENVGLESCSTIGIFPRDATNDRTPDIISLAAQLFGERGATSRYEYTYIDSNGELQDARANASFWECLEKFGELASEGLVYNYYNDGNYTAFSTTTVKGNDSNLGNGFMEYDYSQTQTTQMFDDMLDDNYLFGAISTPVSKWDVDGDGTKDDIMRFNESWRSTKTGGLVVAASVANDENKLAAVLTFIDYLYSNDGQILSTYGIQSTNGNTDANGTWYGNYVASAENNSYCEEVGGQWVVKEEYESSYFTFNNNLYTGTLYKGKMTPIVTDELYTDFLSKTSDVYTTFSARGSFTTYARKVLGATLPMGVKDQSFENQLTATEAAAEASKVSVSLANGTIQHVTLSIDSSNYWYTCVPTGLPLTSRQNTAITDTTQSALRGFSGTNMANSKNFFSLFHHIIWEGYTGTYNQQGYTLSFGTISDASTLVNTLNSTYGLSTRVAAEQSGWETAVSYWAYLSSK